MKNSIPLGSIRIFILSICLTSCGSKKQQKVTLPADFKGPKKLARLYGIRIIPEGNIFLHNEGTRRLDICHRLGGSTKRGVDYSGFVLIAYREAYEKQPVRSSADMLKYNCKKMSRAKLQEEDLVSFKTGRSGKHSVPDYAGIYLGNGHFVHTSTSSDVMVSSLSELYYTRIWLTGGRVK